MANGTIGVSQIDVLTTSGTGTLSIVPPATNTNRTLTLPDGTGTIVANGVNGSLVSATAVTCAGQTSIDFTGIPSWVKRITVMFSGVSTSGASPYIIQLGAGSVTTSGYIGFGLNASAVGVAGATQTVGIPLINTVVAGNIYSGIITVATLGSNSWSASSTLGSNSALGGFGGGSITLGGTLDRIRITTVNGTDTFDTTPSAGTVNIMYE